jgi:hypothetical protein
VLRRLLAKLRWRLRQLLPLVYRTYYADSAGCVHFVVWRMWLGRCFAVDDVVLDIFENLHNPNVAALARVLAECNGQCESCPHRAG